MNSARNDSLSTTGGPPTKIKESFSISKLVFTGMRSGGGIISKVCNTLKAASLNFVLSEKQKTERME